MKYRDPKKTIIGKDMLLDEMEDGTLYPRSCEKNIAKMTVREYLYCERHYWGGYGVKHALKENLSNFAEGLCGLLCTALQILLWPVVRVIIAKCAIKRGQEFCRKWVIENEIQRPQDGGCI